MWGQGSFHGFGPCKHKGLKRKKMIKKMMKMMTRAKDEEVLLKIFFSHFVIQDLSVKILNSEKVKYIH